MKQYLNNKPILVVGGTGKTGKRVAAKLTRIGKEVRIASRKSVIPFDWYDETGWKDSINGIGSVYLTFYPDLAVTGASDKIANFCELAKLCGVERITLLSGRGEKEAQVCEDIVKSSGLFWSILRCSWFSQNFSESFFRDFILSRNLSLPVNELKEPFIDAEDIADLAVKTLITDDYINKLYEITGPELLSFKDVTDVISEYLKEQVSFTYIPHQQFISSLKEQGVPNNMCDLVSYLFRDVLDGRNEYITNDFEEAMGRKPKKFKEYVKEVVLESVWV